MKNTKKNTKEFHAVEFMNEVRSEMTEQFLQDKQKYLAILKEAMDDFKLQQTPKKAHETFRELFS